jgi:hypothetical protein
VPILLQKQPLSINERYYPQIDCSLSGCLPCFLCRLHRTFVTDLTEMRVYKLSQPETAFSKSDSNIYRRKKTTNTTPQFRLPEFRFPYSIHVSS